MSPNGDNKDSSLDDLLDDGAAFYDTDDAA